MYSLAMRDQVSGRNTTEEDQEKEARTEMKSEIAPMFRRTRYGPNIEPFEAKLSVPPTLSLSCLGE